MTIGTTELEQAFPLPVVPRQSADALGPRAKRTITRIVEATREVFLTNGYTGTTIDDIARAADVSRASFYTYFLSKREVLLVLGERSATDAQTSIERLIELGTTTEGLTEWVRDYFEFLEINGSFAFAWTQAAHDDQEILTAGMKRHLNLCQRFGEVLAASAGIQRDDATQLGLVMFSALERSWSYCHLYDDGIDRRAVEAATAQMLWSATRQKPFHTSAPQ